MYLYTQWQGKGQGKASYKPIQVEDLTTPTAAEKSNRAKAWKLSYQVSLDLTDSLNSSLTDLV